MKSPVTYSANVECIDKISSEQIIDQYKTKFGIDVSKYFRGIQYVEIYQCRDSHYRFYYPETIFGDADFYTELQKIDFYYPPRKWEYNSALKHTNKGDFVLDVGCGSGIFIEYLNKSDIKAAGLELNPKAIEICRQKGLSVIDELIEKHADNHSGEYDVVCAFQVLEHIYDVKSFIDGCCKVLKKGGRLVFSVPNNYPYFLKYDRLNTLNMPPHHAGLWNKESFKSLPGYFPIKVSSIYTEPLLNRYHFVETYLRTHGKSKTLKLFKSIRPGLTNRLLYPLRFFMPGDSIVAVFEK
jgi:2-polyprenyl-3-methyl-5-hydroxy-6-metoxy-1,4-benzoquinol methylase